MQHALLICIAAVLLAAYMVLNLLGKSRTAIRNYSVRSDRIGHPFRIVLVTDLHNSRFGPGMQPLLDLVSSQEPDCILLGGDLYHDQRRARNTDALLAGLPSVAPCLMVLGNHEKHRTDVPGLCRKIESFGIRILSGENAGFSDTGVTVTGIEDFGHKMPLHTLSQLRKSSRVLPAEGFRVLLVHRPDLIPLFLRFDYDLILCGHTHGGQLRLPSHPSGLFAPGQGFFPKYGGGEFLFPSSRMIISRGLSKAPWWAARIGNPPELCVIDLLPEDQESKSR